MTRVQELKKMKREFSRLQQCESLEGVAQRKADTRRKIELGGLAVKAGLSSESKAVVLGLMISGKKLLAQEPGTREHFKSVGERAFMGFNE